MKHTFLERLLNFLPLIIFSYYSLYATKGAVNAGAWAYPFYAGAAVAVLITIYFYYKHIPFDYIAVGCSVFLLGGALGFMGLWPLLIPYGLFKQSTIFFFIALVGSIATLFSKQGFIQDDASLSKATQRETTRYSWILVGSAVGAFVVSYLLIMRFNWGTTSSVVLPFIALLHARDFLRQ